MSSLIPKGFHITAHQIFKNYQPPIILNQINSNSNIVVVTDNAIDDNLTIFKENKSEIKTDSEECAICLCNFNEPVTLIKCYHNFCFKCISHWCEKTNTCPLCKSTNTDFIKYNSCININTTTNKNTNNNCDNLDITYDNKFHIWRFVEDMSSSKEIESSKNEKYSNNLIQSAIKYHNIKFQFHINYDNRSINTTTAITNHQEKKDNIIKKKQKKI